MDPVPPPNVTLSIDKFIQYVLYAQIRDGVVANRADSGCAVLVKIDTGEILGMASYPSFNPNNYGSTPAKDIRNVQQRQLRTGLDGETGGGDGGAGA